MNKRNNFHSQVWANFYAAAVANGQNAPLTAQEKAEQMYQTWLKRWPEEATSPSPSPSHEPLEAPIPELTTRYNPEF